ncbi:beta-1,3-glucanase family protein [Spirillospora sp. CA-294931]|uniref:beta-1,3-glucanase family protein n=1 Tax=Spirillospora sp. CA-294931 TaxID=3240042 RepID=UPI003D8BC15A
MRTILIAGALAGVLALGTAAPASSTRVATLPLHVSNDSGRSEQVHLYVLGTDLASGRLGYVTESGTFTPWPAGSNPPSPAPDAAIPGPGPGARKTLRVPRGTSGRMYMSFGEKLKFFLTPDGLVQPAPWNPSDPNHAILFDWSEFTYNDAGLWLNSSQVDMFSVPHAVSVTGGGGTKRTGLLVPGGRDRVFDAVRAQPGWDGLISTRPDGTRLRVLSPGKALDAGRFSASYLDGYVDQAWNTYRSRTLTVVPFQNEPGTRFEGRTDAAGALQFTDGSGARVATFHKPSTRDVLGCDGRLHAPNDRVVGPIARTLCAGLHRSTLGHLHTQPTYDAADFYKQDVTDHYSRVIHANMTDGRAFGFAFDDVGGFESLVHDAAPTSAEIALTPF